MGRLGKYVFAGAASLALTCALGVGTAPAFAAGSLVGDSMGTVNGKTSSQSTSAGSASSEASSSAASAAASNGAQATAADLEGTWVVVGAEYGGTSMDLDSLGLDMTDLVTFDFAADGTGTVESSGVSADMTWKVSGNTVTIESGGASMDLTYDGTNLSIEQDGATLLFGRDDGTVGSDAAGSGDTSTQSDAGMSADPTKVPGVWMLDSVGDSNGSQSVAPYGSECLLTFNDDGTGTLAFSGTDVIDFTWDAKGESVEVVMPGDSYHLTLDFVLKDGTLSFTTAGVTMSFAKGPVSSTASEQGGTGSESIASASGSSDASQAPLDVADESKIAAVTGDPYEADAYSTIVPDGWTADDSGIEYYNETDFYKDSDTEAVYLAIYDDATYADSDAIEYAANMADTYDGTVGEDLTIGAMTYHTVSYDYQGASYISLFTSANDSLVVIVVQGADLTDADAAAIIYNLQLSAPSTH